MVSLTKQESELLQLLPEGLSYLQLARRMGISFHTVKFHLNHIYDKFECWNQVMVVVKAIRLGMIHIPLDQKAAA